MPLYRIFEGKDKKKCYVKNVRGKALSAIEITARNAVRPTSHFSEEEIKAFGLEDHEREVVTGISLVEKAQEKFKDAEEPHYVVFVPFTNRHQVYERDENGNLSAIGIDAKESYEDSYVFTRREMLERILFQAQGSIRTRRQQSRAFSSNLFPRIRQKASRRRILFSY